MHPLDLFAFAVSLCLVLGVAVSFARRQTDAAEFFTGSRRIGWPLACASLVATETSGITFIGVPALAYGGTFTFLQMAFGYLLGRVLVAVLLVPQIRRGNHTSVYEYIHTRLGPRAGALTALVFLITRLLADGVRLYVTALPLQFMTGIRFEWAVAIILAATAFYSLLGGIRGIVWLDTIQLVIYLAGGLVSLYVIASLNPDTATAGPLAKAAAAGKTVVFDFSLALDRYTLWAGLIGGAAFSLASHGTDHLMAQRYLLVPTDRDAQKVVIGSGILVFFQFWLFLLLGAFLFDLWPDRVFADPNAVYPAFIVEKLTPGVRGFVLSAIFAAAMSTLSSSINALAASTVRDLAVGLFRLAPERAHSLALARFFSLVWVAALGGAAFLTAMAERNVVDLAMGIASITYGGVLGIFLLGRFTRIRGGPVAAGFLAGTGSAAYLFFFPPLWGAKALLTLLAPGCAVLFADPIRGPKLFWPWLVPVGTVLTVTTAVFLYNAGGGRYPVVGWRLEAGGWKPEAAGFRRSREAPGGSS
jgi:SSS family transporter